MTPVPGVVGNVSVSSAVGVGVGVRDSWRCSVAALLRHATHLPPITLVHRLHTVLKVFTYV